MLSELGRRMNGSSDNINKEIENIKKNQSELKDTITEMTNTLEGISSRQKDAEEQINNLQDRVVEIIQAEKQKRKNNFKNETSLRDLWDNIQCNNTCIQGVPEKEKRKGQRTHLKK